MDYLVCKKINKIGIYVQSDAQKINFSIDVENNTKTEKYLINRHRSFRSQFISSLDKPRMTWSLYILHLIEEQLSLLSASK